MLRPSRLAALLAFLLASFSPVSLPAQQSWGEWSLGTASFGDWRWAGPVANVAALPVGGATGTCRWATAEEAVYCYTGSAWVVASGGGGASDHGALTGLADDDHTQYALLAGRENGQTIRGGTVNFDSLRLRGDADDQDALDIGNGGIFAQTVGGGAFSLDADVSFGGGTVTVTATAGPLILNYGAGANDAVWLDTRADDAACAAGNYRLWVNTAATRRLRWCENGVAASILTDAHGLGALANVDETGCDEDEVLTRDGAGGWVCAVAAGGGNSFETIATTSGTAPVADAPTDTLTLTAGSGITVTGDSATDTVTIAATGGGTGDVVGPASAPDLAVAAFDGVTGKLIKARDLTIADVAGASVAVATTPGNALALAATAPTAAAGASQAGKAVSITASNAVASTDTAGAAAGGDVTITSGASARLTSGGANGGQISLVPGAGSAGGGVQGMVQFGSAGFLGGGYRPHTNAFVVAVGNQYTWVLSNNIYANSADTGLARDAAGRVRSTNGSSGTGDFKTAKLYLTDPGTRPTCDVTLRGVVWVDTGGAGVKDDVAVCAKDSSDVYDWRAIY